MGAPDRLLNDVEAVRSQGYEVTIVEDGTRFYVVFSNFSLPSGYVPETTNVMFIAD
jgi:hypothetical protein